jgi:hypothetical protein
MLYKYKKNMEKILIIGCGTGRCGTTSLARFLNLQKTALFSHELEYLSPRFLPIWGQNKKEILNHLEQLLITGDRESLKYVGDVAMFYLPYVNDILQKWPNTIFICLQREENKTVDSFMKKTTTEDFWRVPINHQNTWSDVYPKFVGASSKKESIKMYWNFYYKEAYRLSLKFPHSFYLISTEELNTEKGMKDILLKCNIQPVDQIVNHTFHENKNVFGKKYIFLFLKIKIVTILKIILNERTYNKLKGIYYYLKNYTLLQKATL